MGLLRPLGPAALELSWSKAVICVAAPGWHLARGTKQEW